MEQDQRLKGSKAFDTSVTVGQPRGGAVRELGFSRVRNLSGGNWTLNRAAELDARARSQQMLFCKRLPGMSKMLNLRPFLAIPAQQEISQG